MAVIQLTSPLILAGDPTLPLHPVTKQYADNKLSHLDASGFTDGIIAPARLPAFIGDITKAPGSNSISLTPTGVTPGTYTRVTINSSGRIISGGSWTSASMPTISWSKIVTGKPTTLAGYGIANALTSAGGTITGPLSLTSTPTNNYHLVNKGYVDGVITAGSDGLFTGDVVRMANLNSPLGFLRCNGGKVSKTTYIALYAVIGDKFQVLIKDGTEKPFVHQERLNLNGTTAGLVSSYNAVLNTGEQYTTNNTTFITNGRVFAVNCANNGGYRYPRIFSAIINPDGSFGEYNLENFPTFHSLTGLYYEYHPIDIFFTKNKVWFVISNKSVYVSTINTNGTITEPILYLNAAGWKAASSRVVTIKDKLYIIDYNYTGTTGPCEVVYSTIDGNGNFSGFTSLGSISPNATKDYVMDAFVYKNKLIAIISDSNISGVFTPWYTSINSDGTIGPWSAGPTISGINSHTKARAITTANGIYIPYTSGTAWFTDPGTEISYQAPAFKMLTLNTDATGTPFSWNTTGVLGNTGSKEIDRNAVVAKNRLYLSLPVTGKGYYLDFTGGLNDYSPYYDGSLSEIDPLNFFLPDFTSKETAGTKYFIKT